MFQGDGESIPDSLAEAPDEHGKVRGSDSKTDGAAAAVLDTENSGPPSNPFQVQITINNTFKLLH